MACVFKRGGKANRKGWWYAKWVDHDGKQRYRCLKTTDKTAAERIAAKPETDAALRRDGVIDASQDRYVEQRRRPVSQHVNEYLATLRSRASNAEYVKQTEAEISWLIGQCGFGFICDISSSAILTALDKLSAAGRSARTWNSYLRSIKSFTRWLVNDRRAVENPLLTLQKRNEEIDRRHVRREISPEEFEQLLRSTDGYTCPAHSLPGPDRAIMYRLAAGTGFRANELRSLTPESFDLDADTPTVTVLAGYSKNRSEAIQPINPELARDMRAWLAGRPARQPIFPRIPSNTARMMRHDLTHARDAWLEQSGDNAAERERREKSDFLAYSDDDDEVFDFHGLRHLFISSVVNSGASVKVAQELARHSTPTLTIGRYAHARLHDLKGALSALPGSSHPKGEPQREAARATGTYGRAEPNAAQLPAQQTRCVSVQFSSPAGGKPIIAASRKPFENERLCSTMQPGAIPSEGKRIGQRPDSKSGAPKGVVGSNPMPSAVLIS